MRQKLGQRQRGFSMISILISVAIIGILVVFQLQSMQSATKGLNPGQGSASVTNPSFGNATTIHSLKQIHMMQLAYHQRFGRYATFEELVADGSIPAGYSAREDDPSGVAFVRYYDLELHAGPEHYILLAFPNSQASIEFPDVNMPAYRITEKGEVTEEEGLSGGLDEDFGDGPDAEPDPFADFDAPPPAE
ncbi:MAG: hypothetical protein GEEBNDBF_01803 [bacterium]|nr:hypothetical protein [bacterium]